MSFFEKLLKTDSRIIYLIMLIGIAIPLINPLGLPLEIVDTTRQAFQEVEKLAPGAKVLVSFDYSPGGAAGLDPIFRSHAQSLSAEGREDIRCDLCC